MNKRLSEFGLYPDTIDEAIGKCENIIEEARALMYEYGTDEDQNKLDDANIGEMVRDSLSENCDFTDMTNSFISAYYNKTKSLLEKCPTFKEMGISFDSYTNCDDSHFFIESPQGTERYVALGDLRTVFEEVFVEKYADELEPLIEKLLENSGEEYPREWIVEDLNDALQGDYVPFDIEDARTSIENGELTESIAKHIEENAQPIEKETVKKKAQFERD